MVENRAGLLYWLNQIEIWSVPLASAPRIRSASACGAWLLLQSFSIRSPLARHRTRAELSVIFWNEFMPKFLLLRVCPAVRSTALNEAAVVG